MKTPIKWNSNISYTGECTCISLDPVSVRVRFKNCDGKVREEVWMYKEGESWRCTDDNYPNRGFENALNEALRYFKQQLDNDIDKIVLDYTESTSS